MEFALRLGLPPMWTCWEGRSRQHARRQHKRYLRAFATQDFGPAQALIWSC